MGITRYTPGTLYPGCARCRYVSFSKQRTECLWFSQCHGTKNNSKSNWCKQRYPNPESNPNRNPDPRPNPNPDPNPTPTPNPTPNQAQGARVPIRHCAGEREGGHGSASSIGFMSSTRRGQPLSCGLRQVSTKPQDTLCNLPRRRARSLPRALCRCWASHPRTCRAVHEGCPPRKMRRCGALPTGSLRARSTRGARRCASSSTVPPSRPASRWDGTVGTLALPTYWRRGCSDGTAATPSA